MGLSAIMGMVWNTMVKNIVLRRRPYFDHEAIKILRVVDPEADIYDVAAQGYSFPSAHSTNAATMFGSLAVNLHRRWVTVIAIIIAVLTGLSRIVVGAHYPTDVLAGWLLGAISVLIVQVLQKRIRNTYALYGILVVTAIPGFFYCRSTDYFTSMGLLIGFMAGTLLDDRYVHFENTCKPIWMVARVLGGLAVYLALNTVLKLPFQRSFWPTAALPLCWYDVVGMPSSPLWISGCIQCCSGWKTGQILQSGEVKEITQNYSLFPNSGRCI
jgi:undecaprenyl-diphosphatase